MLLRIRLTPNARKDEIVGWEDTPAFGRCLKVRIKDRPIDGKANQAAAAFLAKAFRVPKAQVKIVKGHVSRIKVFQLPDSIQLPD